MIRLIPICICIRLLSQTQRYVKYSLTCGRIAQFSTQHKGILVVPIVATHTVPPSTVARLNISFYAISQTNTSMSTTGTFLKEVGIKEEGGGTEGIITLHEYS